MTRAPAPADVAALVHALEVHQAELEVQNQELMAANVELRRNNAELAFARDRYRALYEVAPAPLITIDPGGVILDVNHAAEALVGTPRRQLIDRRLLQLVAEAGRLAVPALIANLFATGLAQGVELELSFDVGPAVEVLVDGVVLADDGPPRAVLAFVDVGTRKRVEEMRRALDRGTEESHRLESLGVLAGGIAHDFNNLLAVVLGGTDHALRGLDAGSPLAETLGDVRLAARRAADLAHQMLAYAGHGSVLLVPLDLGELLRDLEPKLRAAAPASDLVLDIAGALPRIAGDDTQLRRIVLNLVINAAEATAGRAGRISITARAEGSWVVVEVRDDGAGMDAATAARIFEPYFSTKFVGRGLGLAVAHGIVRGHGGTVTVASELGRGATFRVCLPVITPAAA